ncbi:MAG: transcription termination factor Rho [Acidimicrobiia bacterium]
MSAETLERSVLEGKDRDQLVAIAQALGVKSVSRAKKADLIGKILEQTGSGHDADHSGRTSDTASSDGGEVAASGRASLPIAEPVDTTVATVATVATTERSAAAPQVSGPASTPTGAPGSPDAGVVLGPDGEPLAEWEIALLAQGGAPAESGTPSAAAAPAASPAPARHAPDGDTDADLDAEGEGGEDGSGDGDDSGEGNRRRRRRRRGRNRGDEPVSAGVTPSGGTSGVGDQQNRFQDRPREERPRDDRPRDDRPRDDRSRDDRPRPDGQRDDDRPSTAEPITVAGYLDLREEGYGFLRVNGYLASRDDAYVSVKQTRQHGLRRGDHVTGLMRPAGRNEKNAALLEIHTVNGDDPEKARNRPRFEDLTPLFPDEKLHLSSPSDPTNMTARIIDLISPIGKGQRGLIVSPPKAGKTTIMKTIATSIERNNPEVKLIVLLIDERPEEVTDMRRTVQGEVIASTFDRPSEEHTHLAELAIERAKRMVESGQDVVIILDGITRLSRAYNLAAPATGRIMSGGIDAGALYPPKKFFGAARNIEEGGSLTILATALVETNSRMDDAIFEEFKGTGNMELRLDRKLAERRIFPAIDVDASSTRHEELLFDRKQLQLVWKLRRVLSGLAADGNAAPGLELLIDRLKTFRTNDEFLNEISKQPAV